MSEQTAGSTPALARAEGYWFLATLIARPPTPESLARLAEQASAPVPDGDVGRLLRQLREISSEPAGVLADRLAPEHARLFGGLHPEYGPPPPFESVYRGGQFMGDVTLGVAQFFAEAGMGAIDESLGPCDHLASELMFMAALCVKESEARSLGGDRPEEPWLRKQHDFAQQHLLAWLPAWETAISQAATGPYFRTLAKLTLAAVRSDASFLEESLLVGRD